MFHSMYYRNAIAGSYYQQINQIKIPERGGMWARKLPGKEADSWEYSHAAWDAECGVCIHVDLSSGCFVCILQMRNPRYSGIAYAQNSSIEPRLHTDLTVSCP